MQEIATEVSAHDIQVMANAVDYIHHTSDTLLTEISQQLHRAATASDHQKQFAHALAYLVVLGVEVEKLLQEMNGKIE